MLVVVVVVVVVVEVDDVVGVVVPERAEDVKPTLAPWRQAVRQDNAVKKLKTINEISKLNLFIII